MGSMVGNGQWWTRVFERSRKVELGWRLASRNHPIGVVTVTQVLT